MYAAPTFKCSASAALHELASHLQVGSLPSNMRQQLAGKLE